MHEFDLIPSEIAVKVMTKLGYSKESLSKWQHNYVKNYIHVIDVQSNEDYVNYSRLVETRRSQLQPLVDAIETNRKGKIAFHRLKDIYSALTMSELEYIGW